MIGQIFSWFKLDHRPLSSQRLFKLVIGLPVVLFFFFGIFSWVGSNFRFDSTGFNNFISISKLPLGLLAMAIPLVAVVSSIHRSIQTSEQIKHAEEKKNEESESLIAGAAEECLKKAYELISDDGKIIKNPILWKNSASLIGEFNKKKDRLKIPEIIEWLEVEEDYSRAKFESLIGTLKDVQDVREIRAHPAIIFLVAEFSVWRTRRQDAAPYSTTKEEFANILKRLEGNQAIQDYLKSQANVLLHHISVQMAQSIKMQHPDDVESEAIRSGDVDDPAVVRLRQQREASHKGKND